MSQDELDAQAEQMLKAALGDLTPHQVLLQASRADDANVDERAAAIARNRERALRLLAALEDSLK